MLLIALIERRSQDGGADERHLRILHGHYLRGQEGRGHYSDCRGLAVQADCHEQENTGQDAGQLGGQVGKSKAVLKHGDGEETQQGPRHASPATEDRSATQHHCRDRRQLVAGAGIRFGLTQVSDIDDGGQARYKAREQVNQGDESFDRQSGVPCPFWRKADRDQATANCRSMEQDPERRRHNDEDRHLSRNAAQGVALTEEQKAIGEVGKVVDAAGQSFGESAKHRK